MDGRMGPRTGAGMGRVVAVLCLVLLAGCTREVRVEVPVAATTETPAACKAPPVVARPHLPIADLTEQSTPKEVANAYAASIEACTGYGAELEQALEGYRTKTEAVLNE